MNSPIRKEDNLPILYLGKPAHIVLWDEELRDGRYVPVVEVQVEGDPFRHWAHWPSIKIQPRKEDPS